MIDACPKYYETENSLIVKQENDFTSLNITFINLRFHHKNMSVKYSNDLISTPGCFDCKSWLFFSSSK